ncbi:PDD2L protein, partial [Turnix velox]|nr:PDD2L protein [Turnix velox]
SWRVLRSQYLQAEEKEPQKSTIKQKQESNFAAKDWCEEADDWGGCDEAEPPIGASLQLLGLSEARSSSCFSEPDCTSQFQQLHLSEATGGSGSLNPHPPASQGMVMDTSSPDPVFQPFYISVVNEEDYTGDLDTEHVDQLLREYQQREGVDVGQLMSESFAGEGGNEKYEKSEVKNWDHTFHKFMKRISVCPEQILRYSWGGQPLFIASPPTELAAGVPACEICGSHRVFEFQLMPALVSLLHSHSGAS